MRNLRAYPVTSAEVIDILETVCKEEDAKKLIGGTRGMILHDILWAAKNDPSWFENTFHKKFGYHEATDA